MAAELIAVVGATMGSDPPATVAVIPPGPTPPASTISDKVKCEGKAAYFTIVVTATIGSFTSPPGTIAGSSVKAKGNAKAFVREGDSVIVSVPTTPTATSVTVSVDAAGQTTVKAE